MADFDGDDNLDYQENWENDSVKHSLDHFNNDLLPPYFTGKGDGRRGSKINELSFDQKNIIARKIVCPKCKVRTCRFVEKKNFWQKLYYWGTTIAECKKCGTRFPV